jgi:hypothetical protein
VHTEFHKVVSGIQTHRQHGNRISLLVKIRLEHIEFMHRKVHRIVLKYTGITEGTYFFKVPYLPLLSYQVSWRPVQASSNITTLTVSEAAVLVLQKGEIYEYTTEMASCGMI